VPSRHVAHLLEIGQPPNHPADIGEDLARLRRKILTMSTISHCRFRHSTE
jgi:hypothetical protein